jgi:hypothetical protein
LCRNTFAMRVDVGFGAEVTGERLNLGHAFWAVNHCAALLG